MRNLVLGWVVLSVLLTGCYDQPGPTIKLPTPVAVPFVSLLPNSCSYRDVLPDPVCTPGTTNPDVTQDNIQNTICKTGWTTTIRPPVSYTRPLKLKSMQAYGVGDQSPSDFEFDHLISLELGGHPTDIKNLWPEHDASPNQKDSIENTAKRAVCSGKILLTTAQQQIATDWVAFGHALNK